MEEPLRSLRSDDPGRGVPAAAPDPPLGDGHSGGREDLGEAPAVSALGQDEAGRALEPGGDPGLGFDGRAGYGEVESPGGTGRAGERPPGQAGPTETPEASVCGPDAQGLSVSAGVQ